VLYRFDGLDGYPNTPLLRLSVDLYGTTSSAVFRINTRGVEKTLYRFAASSEPFMPAGGLIEVDGTLYGTHPTAAQRRRATHTAPARAAFSL
jgi:hypothetical protein